MPSPNNHTPPEALAEATDATSPSRAERAAGADSGRAPTSRRTDPNAAHSSGATDAGVSPEPVRSEREPVTNASGSAETPAFGGATTLGEPAATGREPDDADRDRAFAAADDPEEALDPDEALDAEEPDDPDVSAAAIPDIAPMAAPTPSTTARAPTRPTYRPGAELIGLEILT